MSKENRLAVNTEIEPTLLTQYKAYCKRNGRSMSKQIISDMEARMKIEDQKATDGNSDL